MYEYVDAHVHASELSEEEIKRIFKKREIVILSVAEDIPSSLKNIHLSTIYENFIPAVGIHPCKVDNYNEDDIKTIEKMISENNIKILGEIGLDKRFCKNFEKQKIFFEKFLKIAKDYDLSVNLHALDSWRDVFDLLIKYDIKKAYFHWYNGPFDLLEEIQNVGYFIGINLAIKIQDKHKEILEKANIENILTESDGPYEYRGLFLHPEGIGELYQIISQVKGIDIYRLSYQIKRNLSKFII